MWLPLTWPLLGIWPTTQACALTGNRIRYPLVCRLVLNPVSHTSQGRILFLILTLGILFMICLGMVLFGSNLFGTLCAFWTCMSISFAKLMKFSFIIFSNRLPISCFFSSPSITPMMQMLEHLMMSQRLLTLSSFLFVCLFVLGAWGDSFSLLLL